MHLHDETMKESKGIITLKSGYWSLLGKRDDGGCIGKSTWRASMMMVLLI